MIPLYGFLEGDVIGLLILADENDTLRTLADKLTSAARVRARCPARARVVFDSKEWDPTFTVKDAGLTALDRFDVVSSRTA
jgi:hypothetical protein